MSRALGLLLTALLLAPAARGADFTSAAAGTTAAQFLALPVGARAIALGQAYASLSDDAGALYWNPAGLTRVQESDAVLSHAAYVSSSFFDYAAYARNTHEYGAFGLGLQYFNAGSIPQTDVLGNSLGSFAPYDLAVSVGYGYRFQEPHWGLPLEDCSFGVAAKWIRSQILNSASTGAVDFGALSPPLADDRLRLGFSLSNLGGTLKFASEPEPLPVVMRFGGSWRVRDGWLASADLDLPRGANPVVALGTEYVLAALPAADLACRAGYNSSTAGSVTGVSGVSFGVGIALRRFSFDYALAPFGGLGLENQLSAGFKFGGDSPAESRTPPPAVPGFTY
jgi:hypothetical protein